MVMMVMVVLVLLLLAGWPTAATPPFAAFGRFVMASGMWRGEGGFVLATCGRNGRIWR